MCIVTGILVLLIEVICVSHTTMNNLNAHEQLAEMANATQQLTQTVTRLEIQNQERGEQIPPNDKNLEDKTLRIDVAEFGGTSHNPEDYLEWEAWLERYFEFKETPEVQQYKVARIKIIKLAYIWLEGIQKQRVMENRDKINT